MKGGGDAGVVVSVGALSTGDVGTEGPGKGERFRSCRSEDVGRDGALVGRTPGDGSGRSRDIVRTGIWVSAGIVVVWGADGCSCSTGFCWCSTAATAAAAATGS